MGVVGSKKAVAGGDQSLANAAMVLSQVDPQLQGKGLTPHGEARPQQTGSPLAFRSGACCRPRSGACDAWCTPLRAEAAVHEVEGGSLERGCCAAVVLSKSYCVR